MEYSDKLVTTVCCAYCNAKLLNVLFHKENESLKHKIKATCPYCEHGSSEVLNITGHIYTGPIGEDESNSPTIVDNIEVKDGVSLFTIKKRKV